MSIFDYVLPFVALNLTKPYLIRQQVNSLNNISDNNVGSIWLLLVLLYTDPIYSLI